MVESLLLWHMWWGSVFCCLALPPLLKNKEWLYFLWHHACRCLAYSQLGQFCSFMQISRRSNKICKLPFKSMFNLAIYIAWAAVIIGSCPHSDIRLNTNAFISFVCSLAHQTVLSLISCLETLTFLSAAPLLVFKSLWTTIWWSDSSGDAPCNCYSSSI